MNETKVLFVDDEINVLSAIRRAVMEEAYIPFFVGSGAEALTIMEKHEISVIITDMRMPVMDGLSLLKIVKEKYPRSVRVVLSGYTQLSQMLATINHGDIFKFITKPWETEEDLLPIIRQAVEYYQLQAEGDLLRAGLAQRNLAYQKIFQTMEHKKAQEQEELDKLRKISAWVFAFWRNNLALVVNESRGHSTKLADVVDVVEEIYLDYLNQLPTVVDSRPFQNLISDIVKQCDKRLIISNISDSEFTTKGNHEYLLMMLRILVHNIPEDYKNISCELVQNSQAVGIIKLIFDIGLKSNQFSVSDTNKLKISCALLNKMGELYNASVSPTYWGDELCTIRVIWEATKA